MINKNRLIKEFMDYVTIDSETLNEGVFQKHIEKILIEIGFDIFPDETGKKINSNGNNIIARRKGEITGSMLGFCAHLDTVSPGNNIQPFIKNDVIYSKGNTILGADDKAGIAIIVEILRSAIEQDVDLGPIELFFSIAEENGIKGSRYFSSDVIKSKVYYILDGTGDPGEIIIQGPGTNLLDVTVKGEPAHAGLCPEKGISAIEVVSEAISKMSLGRNSELTTSNIGTIHGGTATNIVCPEVQITAEIRSLSEDELKNQTDHICHVIKETCLKKCADYSITLDNPYQSFEVKKDDPFLLYTKEVITNLNLSYNAISTGGGSDANNLFKNGITPIILGIGIKDCHTTEEHIATENLELSAKMCYELMINYWN